MLNCHDESAPCTCSCHQWPGVMHIAACCDHTYQKWDGSKYVSWPEKSDG